MEPRSLDKSVTGPALHKARLLAGHENVAAFADRVGIAAASVYRLESSIMLPSADTLIRWAEACGVSIDVLAASLLGHDGVSGADTVPAGELDPVAISQEQLAAIDDADGEAA